MEKRFFQRFACRREIEVYDDVSKKLHKANCKDVSGGGVGLVLDTPLRLMHPLTLYVKAKAGRGKNLTFSGRAVWQKQLAGGLWAVGIAFSSAVKLFDTRMLLG